MVEVFVAWPMPLVWAMVVGLGLTRTTVGRHLLVACCGLLIVSAMPIVAAGLAAPLSWATARDGGDLAASTAKAVVVPTAGSFRDASGRWWPEEGSVRRLAAGIAIAAKLKLPVIVAGGSPLDDQPAEALTVRNLVGVGDADIVVVAKGRNSWETAVALAHLERASLSPVILVTGQLHLARMRAALRRQGVRVVGSIAAGRVGAGVRRGEQPWWLAVVPSRGGLQVTGAALHEYVGIAWYIISGRIRLGDL